CLLRSARARRVVADGAIGDDAPAARHLRRRVGSDAGRGRSPGTARRRLSRHGDGVPRGPRVLRRRCVVASAGRRPDRSDVARGELRDGRARLPAPRASNRVRRERALAPLLRGHRARLAALARRAEAVRGKRMTDGRPPGDGGPGFIRALGLGDVVLMNIVAVVGLRWIARGARTGPASVTLWVLACVAFFVPLAAAVAELASRYPDQGGVYAWVRRAFGAGHGFICGWCLWVNNLFYFPSLLLFGAENAIAIGGDRWQWLATSRLYVVAFVLAGIWIAAVVNVVGLRTGKWLQNAGSAGVWIPARLLIACGAGAPAPLG